MDIEYTQAKSLIEAAMILARERNKGISVAVVDSHGDLVAYGRMVNATIQSGVLAQAKAYTAARERISSAEIAQWAQKTGKDIGYWVDPQITGMAGGVPIVVQDQVIGGMGASGLSEEADEELVEAALTRCSGQKSVF